MERPGAQLETLGHLDELAQVHHGGLLAQVRDRRQIVRDEQIAHREPLLDFLEEADDVGANRDVQRRDRLVEHDEAGAGRERPRDGEPLSLPSAELVREQTRHVGPEADQLQELGDSGSHIRRGQTFVRLDRLADDVAHAHAGAERAVRILEHDLDLAPIVLQLGSPQRRDVAPFELDGPGRRRLGGQHELRGGRLAAPGFSDEPERLPGVDREADPVDGLDQCPSRAEE